MIVKEAIYLVPMSHIDILFPVFCLEICIFEVETNEENHHCSVKYMPTLHFNGCVFCYMCFTI